MPPKAKHNNVLIKVDRHVVQMVGEFSETEITQLKQKRLVVLTLGCFDHLISFFVVFTLV